jgi:hypothetical protein
MFVALLTWCSEHAASILGGKLQALIIGFCGEGPMKTVLIYVDTSKEVGDVDHLKVFANEKAAKPLVRGQRPERRCI